MATPFPKKDVIAVAVTGAAGQIGYALLPSIARGLMLGPDQKVQLRLLEVEAAQTALQGVVMELDDCAFPTLAGCVCTSDPRVAFKGADIAIMCGAFPRKPGMERKDLLQTNAKIFLEQGAIMKEVAAPHCRVLVVGNPANTNALILANGAAGVLDPRNVTALTRLDHNRCKAMATSACGGIAVKNVIIWGNHSGTQVPDVSHAEVEAAEGERIVKKRARPDSFGEEFVTAVQQRGAAIIKARGASSAASASKAIIDHVHDWIIGTKEGEYVSMAVWSNGNPYGVPEGLIYSFPCTSKDGIWSIKAGLSIDADTASRMAATTKELEEERDQATATA